MMLCKRDNGSFEFQQQLLFMVFHRQQLGQAVADPIGFIKMGDMEVGVVLLNLFHEVFGDARQQFELRGQRTVLPALAAIQPGQPASRCELPVSSRCESVTALRRDPQQAIIEGIEIANHARRCRRGHAALRRRVAVLHR